MIPNCVIIYNDLGMSWRYVVIVMFQIGIFAKFQDIEFLDIEVHVICYLSVL